MQGQDRPSLAHSEAHPAAPADSATGDGTLRFNRMPRIQEPLPEGEVKLPGPPAIAPAPMMGWLQALLPLAGLFVMIGVYGGLRGDWRLALPMLAMSGFSMAGSIAGRLARRKHARERAARDEAAYADALQLKRAELDAARQEQQRVRTTTDPDLPTLLARAAGRDPRLWARRPSDGDFLCLRLGTGSLPSSVTVSAPHPAMPDPRLDPAHTLETEYARVPNVPVTADLRLGALGVAGPPAARDGLARALLCHLAAHHAPTDVHLLAVCSPTSAQEWRWLRWLPHTHVLDARTLAFDALSAADVLRDLLEELHRRQNQRRALQHDGAPPEWPWLVTLLADEPLAHDAPACHLLLSPAARHLNASALFLVERVADVPSGCQAVVEVQPGRDLLYSRAGTGATPLACRPDEATPDLCEALARSLAPLRVHSPHADDALPTTIRLLDLLHIDDVAACDIPRAWSPHPPNQTLRVPIGVRRGGQPLWLDLKHTGHGPHGLVAGTTGSGKSELLQTLVVALALTHHPYDVGFVLVDFKGGGAFSGLAALPHVLGMVTDLSGGETERALLALTAEMDRRKRLFEAAGVNDILPYQQLYRRGQVELPLPHLVVIVDEFAELVNDMPEFMEGLIGIARIGRSLGVHLILATQSPAGVVKQQIWANARFRICLRVESRQESMDMLRRPDAAALPRVPGRGYLQVGNDDVFEVFQVARVAGRYRPSGGAQAVDARGIVIARVLPGGHSTVLFADGVATELAAAEVQTDLAVVSEQLGRAAQQMGIARLPSPWPAPLPDHVALPALLEQSGREGWDGVGWPAERAPLVALVGLLDDPARQWQGPLWLDLAEQDGHVILIGAPGAGKGMWVRTLVMSLALTHAPNALHVYLLALGSQPLHVFKVLPHVGGVFSPTDDERIPRLLSRLRDELDARKQLCAEAGVDGLEALRAQRPDLALPSILLVVDGFLTFRTLFQDEMGGLTRLIREGGPHGFHVVLVGDRAGDVPVTMSSVIARRMALRLADPNDYGSVLGAAVRAGREQRLPLGRGWYGRPPLAFQTASPGHEQDESAQIAEVRRVGAGMNAAWQGQRPEPVEALGSLVALSEVLRRVPPAAPVSGPHWGAPIGIDAARLQPVWVDLLADGPHFIVASTPRGGKTTLLVSWVLALAEFNAPRQVQFVLVSGRRDSLNAVSGMPHVVAHWQSASAFCREGLARLASEVARRGAAAPPDAPRIVLFVDDYDEVAAANDREVQAELVRLARHGADVGLHIILSGPLPNMGVGYGDLLVKQLRAERSGFILRVLESGDQNPLGVRVRAAEGRQMPPGRGYVVRSGRETLLQVAAPGEAEAIAAWVERLNRQWTPVRWPEEAGDGTT
ncbi:MAG: type VII secretion protein EssC [Anaerolineae bacterium]|nr:type VII secretion protein EssC [Anaerolineae bacterium]